MSRHAPLLVLLVLAATVVAAGLAAGPSASLPRSAEAATAEAPPHAAAAVSFRFPQTPLPEVSEPDAPLSLTASDGAGLALVALEAEGVLEPPLAFTELHLTFENPRDQVIEGRFRISLPPGAALSRFAMKIDDAWQEGEVVERQRARQAYEDFLHRRQDPALLEQEAGNEFSARVFPIPARGRKELIVSYSHALARADEPYVIPLRGLAAIGRLDVRVLLGARPAAGGAASNLGGEIRDRRVVELSKRDFTPDRDFVVGQDQMARRAGLRQGNLAVVRVAPRLDALPQEIGGLYVLVDSSASRALGYRAQVKRVVELVAGLRDGAGAATPLAVAAFDQEVVPIYEGTAGGFGRAEVERLATRRPLGASDLHRALAWLAGRLASQGTGKGQARYPRVLLVTDGVATAGDTETPALKAAVRALGAAGVERLDALAVGGLRDQAVLGELVTGNLAHDGQRLDGSAPLAEIARRLTLACRSGIAVAIPGAAWVWPQTLDGMQPGDQALVYADLPAEKPLTVALDGRPEVPGPGEDGGGEIATAPRPLLERAWAQARIDRLLHLRETAHAGDEDMRQALVHEVTELSIRHRVLSPYTALLVLETEADYRRFGLDRHALADILTVGPGGFEVLGRKGALPTPETASPVPALKRIRAPERDVLDDADLRPDVGPGEPESAVEIPVPGRVEGGVSGGIAGGVPGGVVGGVPGGAPASMPPPPTPPPMARPVVSAGDEQPVEANAEAPLAATAPRPSGVAETISVEPSARPRRRAAANGPAEEEEGEAKRQYPSPYGGRFAAVMADLAAGRVGAARTAAEAWNTAAPGDVLALLALGEAWEAAGEPAAAARAYGSLIDLFPSRADLRRLAGERLERLGERGRELALDTYRKAVAERPDHPAGHRLLAWALWRAGRLPEAFAALENGLEQRYPAGRFAGVDQVMQGDLGLLAAAWLRAEPGRRAELRERLAAHGATLENEASLRFILTWETDANDVDLHVYDRQGGHAWYGHRELPSGGELIADVTTGYGPEGFVVPRPAGRGAAPYRLKAHYYRRGPMGYGMGTLQVVRHDGHGRLTVEPRPFVVMADDAWIDLGSVGGGKAAGQEGM